MMPLTMPPTMPRTHSRATRRSHVSDRRRPRGRGPGRRLVGSRRALPRLAALLLAAWLPQAGCSSNSTASGTTGATTVTDTLGNKFSIACAGSLCSLSPTDRTNVMPFSCDSAYGTDTFILLLGQILTIHVVNVPSSGPVQISAAEPGRPVACTTDANCPSPTQTAGVALPIYSCVAGLCQATEVCTGGTLCAAPAGLTTNDVITLCQADIPWPKQCPYIVSQPFANRLNEVAASCGANTYCSKVPADCRQPTAALDAGVAALDAGVASADAGAAGVDAGTGAVDGGAGAVDAGI